MTAYKKPTENIATATALSLNILSVVLAQNAENQKIIQKRDILAKAEKATERMNLLFAVQTGEEVYMPALQEGANKNASVH